MSIREHTPADSWRFCYNTVHVFCTLTEDTTESHSFNGKKVFVILKYMLKHCLSFPNNGNTDCKTDSRAAVNKSNQRTKGSITINEYKTGIELLLTTTFCIILLH